MNTRLEYTCSICGGQNHVEHACPNRPSLPSGEAEMKPVAWWRDEGGGPTFITDKPHWYDDNWKPLYEAAPGAPPSAKAEHEERYCAKCRVSWTAPVNACPECGLDGASAAMSALADGIGKAESDSTLDHADDLQRVADFYSAKVESLRARIAELEKRNLDLEDKLTMYAGRA